jgi:hypothetical protein
MMAESSSPGTVKLVNHSPSSSKTTLNTFRWIFLRMVRCWPLVQG